MLKHKCGHEQETVVLDCNSLSISAYLEWIGTLGSDGTGDKCWKCWCENKLSKSLLEQVIKNLAEARMKTKRALKISRKVRTVITIPDSDASDVEKAGYHLLKAIRLLDTECQTQKQKLKELDR